MRVIHKVFVPVILCFLLFPNHLSAIPSLGVDDKNTRMSTDWPQWRGPNRDGHSEETNLVRTFPESGPMVLWRKEIGKGYSGISVAGEYLITMYCEGDYEYVLCLDAEAGLEVWQFLTDKIFLNQHGSGPRSTPTIDGERVFVLSAKGKLYALGVADKQRFWQVDLREHFDAGLPRFGFTTSPLVAGDYLVMEVGNSQGNSVLALDKTDGSMAWQTSTFAQNSGFSLEPIRDQSGYSSPVLMDLAGQQHMVFFTASQVAGFSKDGEMLWRQPWSTRNGANVAAPVAVDKNRIFISSGYNKGCALVQINETGDQAQILWENREMRNAFSSAIYYDGYIYGFDMGMLKCIDVETGDKMWDVGGIGHGSAILADGQLLILSENGRLVLAEANPESYHENAREKIFGRGKCWTPPALANGRFYARNQFEILCVELSK